MAFQWHDMTVSLRLTLLTILCLVAACGRSAEPVVEIELLTVEQAQAALDFVEQKLKVVHPATIDGFSEGTRESLDSLRSRLNRPIPTDRLLIELNKVLSTLQDGHTEIRLGASLVSQYEYLDLDINWSRNGLLITRSVGELARGDRILSIGEKSEADLLQMLRDIVPAENDFSVRYRGARLLLRGDHLRWLNLVDDGGRVKLQVKKVNGEVHTTVVELRPGHSSTQNRNWVDFQLFPESSLGVFRFDRFEYSEELITKMSEFFAAVSAGGFKNIAVDIRGNPGGDSTVAFAFLDLLFGANYDSFSAEVRISQELIKNNPAFSPEAVSPALVDAGMASIPEDAKSYTLIPPFVAAAIRSRIDYDQYGNYEPMSDRHLYLITDGGTFSSGTLFAQLVRDNNLGTIIGGPVGNSANFNGMEMQFDIPGTGYFLNIPSATLIRPVPNRGNERSIYPDVPIYDSQESIAHAEDLQLNYLRQLSVDTDNSPSPLTALLDKILADMVQASSVQNPRSVALRIEVPAYDYVYSGAAGTLRADSKQDMLPVSAFYVASIAKTMVATIALQMVEEGMFTLDTTLQELDIFTPVVLDHLHRYEGVSYGPQLTVRQLLTHRSGLRDYLLDDRNGVGSDFELGNAPGSLAGIWKTQLPSYLDCLHDVDTCSAEKKSTLYPGRTWQAWDAVAYERDPNDRESGLLNFYLSEMGGSGLFAPDSDVHYSDTNFMLMAVIIQELTGQSLQDQLAVRIFQPLGMTNSYMSYSQLGKTAAKLSAPSDFYSGDLPVVSTGVDISWDWGGGGVVSSAPDLAFFLRGLFEGQLFNSRETLQEMLDFQPVLIKDGQLVAGYGLGIRSRQTKFGPMLGHSGAWGSEMEYYPELGVYITGTVNTHGSSALKKHLMTEPLLLLLDGFLR